VGSWRKDALKQEIDQIGSILADASERNRLPELAEAVAGLFTRKLQVTTDIM